jgi:DnaK suppressor protein
MVTRRSSRSMVAGSGYVCSNRPGDTAVFRLRLAAFRLNSDPVRGTGEPLAHTTTAPNNDIPRQSMHTGPFMKESSPELDAAYVEGQRRRLTKLREDLRKTSDIGELQERNVEEESHLQARENEDDAQKLDMLEKEGSLVSHAGERLALVERALSKIREGTYGISDVSGRRIPKERLDATPEAINTLAEQNSLEKDLSKS